MELKQVLKTVKLYESTISMVLGALVLATAAFLVFSYFRNLKVGQVTSNGNQNQTSERKIHKVAAGETLWSIADTYYNDGYAWGKIAEANFISNPDNIEKDIELIIPEAVSTINKDQTVKVGEPKVEEKKDLEKADVKTPAPALPSRYRVVRGDDLWKIAVKVYGNGYKWTEIAKVNRIKNPNVIFVGSTLTIPR